MQIELKSEEWELIKEWLECTTREDTYNVIEKYSLKLDEYVVDDALANLYCGICKKLEEDNNY